MRELQHTATTSSFFIFYIYYSVTSILIILVNKYMKCTILSMIRQQLSINKLQLIIDFQFLCTLKVNLADSKYVVFGIFILFPRK